jgi:hypothetical protein
MNDAVQKAMRSSKEKSITELARAHRDERLVKFKPDFFRYLVKQGKANY